MQGLFFNNREWLALFLTVGHTITDGAIDVILIETSKISMSVNKNTRVFIVVIYSLINLLTRTIFVEKIN